MGRIQSSIGLATGIDIQKTVDQLMSVSARPRDQLQTRIKGLQAQQVALNELTALVIGAQLQTDRIGNASNLSATAVSSSRTSVLNATSSGSPTVGNYSVQVLQTAQTASAASSPIASESELLQAGEFVVRTGGFVDASANLDDLRGGAGISRGLVRITDRSGQAKDVDLRFASTLEDVLRSINNSGLRVSARINGDRIVLSDLTGQTTSNLMVEEVFGGRTASDLGLGGINVASNSATGGDVAFLSNASRLSTLRDNRGISFSSGKDMTVSLKDGSSIDLDVNSSREPTTLGQLVANINAISPSKLEAKINSTGDGLELVDKTSGSGTFAATGKLADQLGFTGTAEVSGSIVGTRIQSTLNGPLLSSLRGGNGIGVPSSVSITNRSGVSTSVNLVGATSLRDVIDRINASNAGVTASLNRSRTGLLIQDVTGATTSNLIIADSDANGTATKLGIATNADRSTIDSAALGFQFVSETTSLSRLNQGRGVRLGNFVLTNSQGLKKTIVLNSNTKTVGDVLNSINNNTIGIQARLNEDGDGILITDTTSGTSDFTIVDEQGGNAALDLGIRGTGTQKSNPARREIQGSQTFRLTIAATDSMSDVVKKINDANGPLTASLLTSGPSNVRMLFTSRSSGDYGRFYADGESVGLNINSTGTGRDAIVSVGGSSETAGTLVRSSSNTVQNAIGGVSLTVQSVSTDPVEVVVSSNNSSLEKNLQLFVDQFNKIRDKVTKETAFDASTKTSGLLLGNPEVLRTEQALARLVSQRSFASGQVQSLDRLGISLNDKGRLEFDKEKFTKIMASNPDDVKSFLTKESTGFGARAKVVIDSLVGVNNSALVNRNTTWTRQIDALSDRVNSMTARLDKERERLLLQFFRMEESITRIRNNASGLGEIQYLSR
jgi:flagellar hook-associated protein 2